MNVKRIVTLAGSAVGAIFALQSGFLESISPPGSTAGQMAAGIAYLLSIILYLAVLAIRKLRSVEMSSALSRFWVWVSVVFSMFSLVGLIGYVVCYFVWSTDELGEQRQMTGEYIQVVQHYIDDKLDGYDPGPSEILRRLPEARGKIFVEKSVNNRSLSLMMMYVVTVMSICGTIFALCEIIGYHEHLCKNIR